MDGEGVTIGKGTKFTALLLLEREQNWCGAVIEPYSIIGKNSIVSSYSHLQKVLFLQMRTLDNIASY